MEAQRIAEKHEATPHHRLCATQDGRECDCFKSSYDVHILARALLTQQSQDRAENVALREVLTEILEGDRYHGQIEAAGEKKARRLLAASPGKGAEGEAGT